MRAEGSCLFNRQWVTNTEMRMVAFELDLPLECPETTYQQRWPNSEAQSSGERCFRLRQAGCVVCSGLSREQRPKSSSVLDVFLAIFPVPQRVTAIGQR
jgi:hypothetical protein